MKFRSSRTGKGAAPIDRACGSPGKRCYVIGDIHGRFDLMVLMLEQLRRDNERRAPRDTALVFLGDLIDRGPQSREILDFLIDSPPQWCRPYFIKGNHEEGVLRGLGGEPHLLPKWMESGGYELAQSYGCPIGGLFASDSAAIERALLDHVPARHLAFMSTFVETITFGDYLLVHAGIRPGAPRSAWGAETRWIREPFLSSEDDFGYVVVHGHTVTDEVEIRRNRIGLDTGAWRSGRLSALRLEDRERAIITATLPG